ncbi:ROK family transcriptional regulator [Agromyces laixinhei]|uniref:ROK family transcriptional regulator n=1 Tax=Agromyces laixinhei TaxID=2585717 RepID=UPI0012EE6F81|nr:ROK family transcriptional regulator [Agromyces laixinhei]
MRDISTTNEIRRRNRARVLEHLIVDGGSTRMELAEACGLSAASATNMVQDLLAAGLVREDGLVPSGAGRPRSFVQAESDAAYFVGADVGESEVTLGLYDLTLRLRDVVQIGASSTSTSPGVIADELSRGLAELERRNIDAWARVRGIGLALPGIVDTNNGSASMLYAQSIGWPPVAISALLPNQGIHVVADNGAKAFARAELRCGAIKGQPDAESAVVVLLGRGVGMGILEHGRIVRGLSSSAGEFGHMKVVVDGPQCSCGARGCLEALVGSDAIAARWYERGGASFDSARECIAHLVRHAADDPLAAEVLDDTVRYLTTGLSNVVNMINPGLCVIGGWLGSELMAARAPQIEAGTKSLALAHPGEQVRVLTSRLGGEAIALGGALIALEQYLETLGEPAPHSASHVPTTSIGADMRSLRSL